VSAPADEPLNVADLKADDELVETLRAGDTPDDTLGRMLGAWRDDVRPEDRRG